MTTTINEVGNALSGSTGTGAFVGSTSPTLISPALGTPASGNLQNCSGYPASGVTGIASVSQGGSGANLSTTGGTSQVVQQSTAGGDFTVGQLAATNLSNGTTGSGAVVLANTPTITTPVTVGVTNGTAASSGNVGQIVSSTVNPVPGVSMTNNTFANITSISLPAGDWDIMAQVSFNPAPTTTVQGFVASISLTSATAGSNYNINESVEEITGMFITGAPIVASVAEACATISTTTTYYLVANVGFGVSTMSAGGKIIARRRR